MKRSTLERALFVAFFFAMFVAAPERDYDPPFGVLMTLIASLPFVLLSVALSLTAMLVSGKLLRRSGVRIHRGLLIAIPAVAGLGAGCLFVRFQEWIFHQPWVSILSSLVVPCFVAFAAAVFASVFGAPILAIWLGIMRLIERRWGASLLYFCIPFAGAALFYAGKTAADYVVVRTIGPAIQSTIQDARSGKRLPELSQSFPYVVSGRPYDVGAYMLGGFWSASTYVVYDERDVDRLHEVPRIDAVLDGGRCRVFGSRPIGPHYYRVTETCEL